MDPSSSPEIHLQHYSDQRPSTPSRPIPIPNNSSSSYRSNPWENFDFHNSPGLQYTPSYQGSLNSYNSHSDPMLNWGANQDAALQSTHDNSSSNMLGMYDAGGNGDHDYDNQDYNPQDYDADQNAPYLLLDDQTDLLPIDERGNLMFPDAQTSYANYDSRNQFSPRHAAFASPAASSVGFPDIGNEPSGLRSRASSVSSFHGIASPGFNPPSEYKDSITHSIQDDFSRLKFDQSEANANDLSYGNPAFSPNKHSIDLSQTAPSPPAPGSPGAAKPLSPPLLMIPGEGLMPPQVNLGFAAIPNANDSLGPQPAINIMPATPVSGGGAGGAPTVPFQHVLRNLNNQRRLGSSSGPKRRQFGSDDLYTNTTIGKRGNNANAPTLPSFHSNLLNTFGAGRGSAANGDQNDSSGTDAMTWPSISASAQSQGSTTASAPPTRSMDMSYNLQAIPSYQHHNAPPLHHASTDPTSNLSQQPFSSQSSMNHFSHSNLLAPLQQRSRSKSDTQTRPPLWSIAGPSGVSIDPSDYNATFDDSSSSFPTLTISHPSLVFPSMPDPSSGDITLGMGEPSVRRTISDGGNRSHKRFAKSEDFTSSRSPRLVPTHNTDFIRSVTMADGSLAPVDPRSPPHTAAGTTGTTGPTRRRGSGTHERGASLSSLRSSPYTKPSPHTSPNPSPSASPHLGVSGLPPTGPIHVERQLVTTPATKTASANRRRAEATFVCPIPGCGSTFTRHFNLRGHLRSHNEERPFKCKWPGCEKGFARQHDCKRHEALHLNIRPYTCEGCQKTFARMDALNRHLRSEGGTECAKHQGNQHPDETFTSSGDDQPMIAKVEPDNHVVYSNGGFLM